jgi:hypothetical protein
VITVRISSDQHRQIHEASRGKGRSINSFCVDAILQHCQRSAIEDSPVERIVRAAKSPNFNPDELISFQVLCDVANIMEVDPSVVRTTIELFLRRMTASEKHDAAD